jgi:hypothetical protein
MRQLLVDALDFPRNYIRASLFLNNCIHGGNFQAGEQACESCEQKDPCRWMYSNDECSDPQSKATAELLLSLEASLDYIDTDVAHMGHNIGTCSCHTCLWLKNAENLLSLYQKVKRSTHLQIARCHP